MELPKDPRYLRYPIEEEFDPRWTAWNCSRCSAPASGILGGPYHKLAGDVYGYGRFIEGIKRAIDPNNVSNPPHPYPLETEK
jgi:hypothetical protein